MSKRFSLVLGGLWALVILAAAVLDAPRGFASLLPVIAFVTLVPNARRCA